MSGKVLDCRGSGVSNGTAVQQYSENGTTAQWWRVVVNSDGSVSLISAKSGLALDVTGANSSNGTKLQLYTQNGTLAQKWTLSVPTVFDWVNYYGTTYTPLWGWYRNIALC